MEDEIKEVSIAKDSELNLDSSRVDMDKGGGGGLRRRLDGTGFGLWTLDSGRKAGPSRDALPVLPPPSPLPITALLNDPHTLLQTLLILIIETPLIYTVYIQQPHNDFIPVPTTRPSCHGFIL